MTKNIIQDQNIFSAHELWLKGRAVDSQHVTVHHFELGQRLDLRIFIRFRFIKR